MAGMAGTAGTAGARQTRRAGGRQARQAGMAGTICGSSGVTFHLPRETLYPLDFTDTYVDSTTVYIPVVQYRSGGALDTYGSSMARRAGPSSLNLFPRLIECELSPRL